MALTLPAIHGWKRPSYTPITGDSRRRRPKAQDPHNSQENYWWHRPSAQGGDVKSRFGFTSEFMPCDKGWTPFFGFYIPFLGGVQLIYKSKKILVNLMFVEWRRQRREDFQWLHGLSEEEAEQDRDKWTRSANARQKYFKQLGLV